MPVNDPHQDTRRLGRGMIAAGFVIAIALLTLLFGNLAERAANPNTNPAFSQTASGATEVYLQRSSGGHYVLSGAINGVQTDFILDTGATDVVIPESLANAAGLEGGYASQAMTANGLVTVYSTRIAELDLGAIRLRDVRASINPMMSEGTVLLGMSALRQIEFHQRGDQLTLRYHPDALVKQDSP